MIVAPTFREAAFREAIQCLREADKCSIEDPTLLLNLLGAIINTNIAAIPDSVAASLVHESMAESLARDHVKKKVKEARGR